MKNRMWKMITVVLFSVISYYIYMTHFASIQKRFEVKKTKTKVVTANDVSPKKVHKEVEIPETIEEFMKRYSAIHEKRNNYTREMCRLHRHEIHRMKSRPILLVNEKHKMVYCQTPKAGTVSWCKIMLILAGYKNYKEVMAMNVPQVSAAWKKHVKHLSQFSAVKQKQIMDTYTKFMFVRHPFSRLLSAFNDKLSPGQKSHGRFQYVYSKILTDFRWDKQENSKNVKFEDFINMVINGSYTLFSGHWREMYTICYPCDIHYDVIGHIEDMENESKYILTLSHVTDLMFPHDSGSHFTNSSSQDKINRVYSSLPDPLLTDLYKKFKYDFTLFDYEIPLGLKLKGTD